MLLTLVPYVCMCAGLQPVLVHLSKNKSGKFSFNPISVNLMTEIFKVVFALTVLLFLVSWQWRAQQQWEQANGAAAHRHSH